MSFLKFQADQLFTGTETISSKNVLICNEHGIVEEIVPEEEAGDNIQKLTGILTPGFINCHCHLELSHMRGLIPENTGLVDFVFSVVTQRHFPNEEIQEAICNAENEMLQNGIVAVGDISNNGLTLKQKQKRSLSYYNFIESSGWLPSIAQERFTRSLELFNSFSQISPSSLVPHAPYSVSDNLWNLLHPYFENKIVSIHNQETKFEDELFLRNTGDFTRMYNLMKLDTSFFSPSGKSSLQTYINKIVRAAQVILVHNTFTQKADIEFLKENKDLDAVFFCVCANANKYIEQSFPPINMLREHNCNIVVGTDSLASNWSLNIIDELRTIQQSITGISLNEMLVWATLQGAKALQMEDKYGSFTKGKKPGVVLIEGLGENENLKTACTRRLL